MHRILTKRERLILSAAIGIAAFSAVFTFIIGPLIKQNSSLDNKIKLAKSKLNQYSRLLANRETFLKKYAQLLAEDPAEGSNFAAALSELQAFARNADLKITDIRPQNITEGPSGCKEAQIDLRAQGSMQEYTKFIYGIENSLLLLRIKRLQLSSKADSADLEGVFSIAQAVEIQN